MVSDKNVLNLLQNREQLETTFQSQQNGLDITLTTTLFCSLLNKRKTEPERVTGIFNFFFHSSTRKTVAIEVECGGRWCHGGMGKHQPPVLDT